MHFEGKEIIWPNRPVWKMQDVSKIWNKRLYNLRTLR
jgi:hypothetical protein